VCEEEDEVGSVSFPTGQRRRGDQRVINVCFHGVGAPARELEPGEDCYWVGRDQFHRLLAELVTWPEVRISFDDGNGSDHTEALPALLDRGLTADFFVLAGRLDAAGCLTRAEVRSLHRHGMRVGSHGMVHRSWRRMDPATRERELVTARAELAGLTGGPVDLAACPLGRYDRGVLADLRRLGYRQVFTSDRRQASPDAWLQPRYSIRRHDTPESLRAETGPGLARRARAGLVGVAKRLR
jgi:peptidoglycan/xylan/chitin deacetylase (PgdA/CDA1 family)